MDFAQKGTNAPAGLRPWFDDQRIEAFEETYCLGIGHH